MTVSSKDIKPGPHTGHDEISNTLQQVVVLINAGTIDGPTGHKGPNSAAGATGVDGHTGSLPAGPTGPTHITQFIPPSTDPHVRGAVWNPTGGTGAGKLAISMG